MYNYNMYNMQNILQCEILQYHIKITQIYKRLANNNVQLT